MRAATKACALILAGLTLVPLGCSDDGTTSSTHGTTTTVGDHHSAVDEVASAPSTTVPTRLDVVATEYEWSGLPDEVPAGSYPMSFRNDGAEAHEVVIFRNPGRVPLEELRELGPVGIKDAVEVVGSLISGPGTPADSEITVTLTSGEYEVVCFVPATSDGRAHFEHGMHQELLVR